jgi:hypothetical protein
VDPNARNCCGLAQWPIWVMMFTAVSQETRSLGRKNESLQKEEMLDESQNFIQGDH